MPNPPTIHLIGNAHIDPVWLWDWREGLNEGLSTCRTMVALLRDFPEATFIRGEAAIYEHIERHDPATFAAIQRLVKLGRWDVVGGTYIQPDTNMPAAEPLLRQFVRGKRYFREKFGLEITTAWSADSFGYTAGMPEILAAAGIDSIAFTRPTSKVFPLAKPAFWWRAPSGARILGYRPEVPTYYCIEREDMPKRLNESLAEAKVSGLQNVACFYGLGNHGGGPTRHHLQQIRDWAKQHPEIRVVHSGLHRMFAALRAESRSHGPGYFPTVDGEINFCLRGCSASVAKFKFLYRRTEAQVLRTERTAAASSMVTGRPAAPMRETWDSLLFNAFHDILPGSSIERAYDDQLAQTGGAFAAAQQVETHALLDLARRVDTRPKGWVVPENHPQPVPVMVWNPHPRPLHTQIEIEVPLDFRPLWDYKTRPTEVPVAVTTATGRLFPRQVIAEEHDSFNVPWRRRVVFPMTLPPLGWSVVQMGLATQMPPAGPASPVAAIKATGITNGLLSVIAAPGSKAVQFLRRGKPWLKPGLQVRVYDDPWGSWGGMREEPDSWLLPDVREQWKIDQVRVLESGPERAAIWVRFAGRNSRLELTFQLMRDAQHVKVRSRVFWNERSARLRLVLPAGGPADYDVPGGKARRAPCGEVPGGRFVLAGQGKSKVGFASDALYSFATTKTEFYATVVRASRYGSDTVNGPEDRPWLPAVDAGELRFNFILASQTRRLPEIAAELEDPPVVMCVPARPGSLPAVGSILTLPSPGLKILSLTGGGRHFELRLQNTTDATVSATVTVLGAALKLGIIARWEIATWQVRRSAGGWRAARVDATHR